MNVHSITKEFEAALCEYTGAKYAVAVNSCTMALTLAVAWHTQKENEHVQYMPWVKRKKQIGHIWNSIEIPSRTYISVPMAIVHGGARPTFRDEHWLGAYRLKPLPVWDCARWFSYRMWRSAMNEGPEWLEWIKPGQFGCVSFHTSKILADTQGGAILHDNAEADIWFRRARFDGRTEGIPPKYDKFDMIGWHCYMNPDTAARLLWKLSVLPKHNDQLPNDDYPDLSEMEIFK